MSEATHVGLSISSEGLVSSPTPSPSSSLSSSRTHEFTDANNDQQTGRLDDDSNSVQEDDNEEVCVGSLDKFLSFSNRRIKKLTWQRSLLELDKNLQRICGPSSSGSAEHVSHSLCNSPVGLYKKFSLSRANSVMNGSSTTKKNLAKWDSVADEDETFGDVFPIQLSSTPPDNPPIHKSPSFLRRADSLWEPTSKKFVPVRHIETHSKLHNQLLKITGGDKAKNNPSFPGINKTGISSSHRGLNKTHVENSKTFECSCIRGCVVEVEGVFQRVNVEDVTVQLDKKSREIEVRCRQIFERSVDVKSQKFQVNENVDHNCLCLLTQDGGLRICKGTKEVAEINYQMSTGHFHLPVIKGDEHQNGQYVMSFYIPDNLNFEDLVVKTVDEYLHLDGHKRRYSANYVRKYRNQGSFSFEPSNEKDLLRGSPDSSENQQFHVVLRLPGSVDTRSVSSYLNHHHLLIVKTSGLPK